MWVYKIGAFPQFSEVTAGQVPDLPVDSHQYRGTGSHRHQHQVQVYPEDQGNSQDVRDGVYHRPEHPPPLQVETVQFTPEVVEIENDDNIQVDGQHHFLKRCFVFHQIIQCPV